MKDTLMNTAKLAATIAAAALIAGASSSIARAQVPPGTVYAFHSSANGTCPVLDWHLVSGENGAISGMVSWNGMQSMAQVSGVIGADRMITMHAKETGGAGRTAVITGDAKSDGWLLLSLKGPNVNCPNIKVPIWRSAGATQSGGGG